MRVFLAGASGAIGRPLIDRLVADGHQVSALTRSPERQARLRARGVDAVVGDVLDRRTLTELVATAAPEIVISQLTDLPHRFSPRALQRAYGANDRVRRDGTLSLLEAGRRCGARRIVVQSIGFWYEPSSAVLATEEDALWLDAPDPLSHSVRAVIDMERSVQQASGIEGIVLRYGTFYGPGTWYAGDGDIAEQVRRRRFPMVGAGEGVQSFVHVQDAATATVHALAHGAAGVYNVVDDEPLAQREWLTLYARALGAPPPRRVPVWLARQAVGATSVAYVTRMRGASNARARRGLDWTPRYESVRTGFVADLA